MEPLTAGAIAFTTWVLGKIIDWSTDKTLDIASEGLMQLLKKKLPDTAKAFTVARKRAPYHQENERILAKLFW